MTLDSRISVVMPVYNALPYLRTAVESVLSQTHHDFEFIILNDSSTDGSAEYLDSLRDKRVRVVHCAKQGYVSLLNLGIELAQTDLVARMDADDMSLPERFETQLRVFAADPSVIVCGCQAELIDAQGKTIGAYDYPLTDCGIRFELLTRCAFLHPGVIYRKCYVQQVGGYRADSIPCDDYDLWVRLASLGRLANDPKKLVKYRVHGQNTSFVQLEARNRMTTQVSVEQVMATGLSENTGSAATFRQLKRKTYPDLLAQLTLAEARVYCEYVEKFIRNYQEAGSLDDQEVAEVRQSVRWRLLHRAKLCKLVGKEYCQWLALAMRIDPRETTLHKLASKAIGNVIRCATSLTR